jgi:hypothetical protein
MRGYDAAPSARIDRAVGRASRSGERELRDELDASSARASEGLSGSKRAARRSSVPAAWNSRRSACEQAGTRGLDELGRDVRYALRQLRRNPMFSAIAVATLALARRQQRDSASAMRCRLPPYHDPTGLFRSGGCPRSISSRDATKTPADGVVPAECGLQPRRPVAPSVSRRGRVGELFSTLASGDDRSYLHGCRRTTWRAGGAAQSAPSGERFELPPASSDARSRSMVSRDGGGRDAAGIRLSAVRADLDSVYVRQQQAPALWGGRGDVARSRRARGPYRPERNFARSRQLREANIVGVPTRVGRDRQRSQTPRGRRARGLVPRRSRHRC